MSYILVNYRPTFFVLMLTKVSPLQISGLRNHWRYSISV